MAIEGEGKTINWFLYLHGEQVQDSGKEITRVLAHAPIIMKFQAKENLKNPKIRETKFLQKAKINLWGEHAPKTLEPRRLTAKRPVSKACPSNRHLKGYKARSPQDNAGPQHMRKG